MSDTLLPLVPLPLWAPLVALPPLCPLLCCQPCNASRAASCSVATSKSAIALHSTAPVGAYNF
jgi:hypothetical protein